MKKLIALFLPIIAYTLSAQTNAAVQAPATACASTDVSYKVTVSNDATIPAPAPGMATLVFVEDQLENRPGHAPCIKCSSTVRLGMDGQWIATTHGFSHTNVSIAPGDHHFCALASGSLFVDDPLQSRYGLHVEAGKTYFLRGRVALFSGYGVTTLDLTQLNEDEGRYLVSISKRNLSIKK